MRILLQWLVPYDVVIKWLAAITDSIGLLKLRRMLILNGDILFLLGTILKIRVKLPRIFLKGLRIHCLYGALHMINVV
jgi:hypothetical protein